MQGGCWGSAPGKGVGRCRAGQGKVSLGGGQWGSIGGKLFLMLPRWAKLAGTPCHLAAVTWSCGPCKSQQGSVHLASCPSLGSRASVGDRFCGGGLLCHLNSHLCLGDGSSKAQGSGKGKLEKRLQERGDYRLPGFAGGVVPP